MTRIDFYILDTQAPRERLLFGCRLAEKAYKMGHHVYIHCESQSQSEDLDQLLWSYRADSFIPHRILGDKELKATKVEIGSQQDPAQHRDVLINFGTDIPQFFSRFSRVAEVVVQDASILERTRKNFGFYRDRGYPLHSHDLRKP